MFNRQILLQQVKSSDPAQTSPHHQPPIANGLDGLFADQPELIDQITEEAM
ncbi:MAG: hypothetical protein AAF639_44625 [Chloroflexota bacterium]